MLSLGSMSFVQNVASFCRSVAPSSLNAVHVSTHSPAGDILALSVYFLTNDAVVVALVYPPPEVMLSILLGIVRFGCEVTSLGSQVGYQAPRW